MKPTGNPAVDQILRESVALQSKFAKYVTPLKESFARKGKTLDDMALATVLQSLKGLGEDLAILESTKSVNVGTFIQHGYDLITAVYPNLVLNNIAAMQPLTSRNGEVWFYNLIYQDAKGGVSAGADAISATRGVRADKHYSSEYIPVTVSGTVNGSNQTFTGTLQTPLKATNDDKGILIGDGIEWFKLNAAGTALVGSLGGTGTINTTSGAFSVTFNTAPVTGATVLAMSQISFEDQPSLIGKTKISLVSQPISAKKHALITDYSLDAEYDIARNFNMNISDELIKGTAALIRAEIDQLGMSDIRDAAKDSTISASSSNSWSGSVPSGVSQLDHFRTLLTMWKKQSNDIYGATRMVHGNFVIVGNDIATVVEILPEFKAAVDVQTAAQNSGPYVAGTIGGFVVIKNPDFAAAEWVVGNRGVGSFNTGYIIAPYRGLMVTPPISDVNNPFSVTRGMYLEAGRQVTNGKFYSYGKATSLTF